LLLAIVSIQVLHCSCLICFPKVLIILGSILC
jgi:hypothetical protein